MPTAQDLITKIAASAAGVFGNVSLDQLLADKKEIS